MLSVRSGLPLAVLAASFAAHGGMAQTTTVVSGGGPALANAVQAAQPGDTLIVRADLNHIHDCHPVTVAARKRRLAGRQRDHATAPKS